MRWKAKPVTPPEGSIRVRSMFLFWPRCVDDQWRWLEFASVQEIYRRRQWITQGWVNY